MHSYNHEFDIKKILKEYIIEELEKKNILNCNDEQIENIINDAFVNDAIENLFDNIDELIDEIIDEINDKEKEEDEEEIDNDKEENNEEDRWRDSY